MVACSFDFVSPENFLAEIRGHERNNASPQNCDPHLTMAWFALLAETATKEGSKLALLPCGSYGRCFLPLLREEGSTIVQGLSNFYSPLFGMVGEEGADVDRLSEMMRVLARREMGISEIRLAPMDTDSISWRLLRQAFLESGWMLGDYFSFGNWFHEVGSGGFAAYFASLSGKLRNTILRHRRKLAIIDGVELRIYFGNETDFSVAVTEFVAVYDKSWKESEPFPAFITGLCGLAAKQGSLRLGMLRVAGVAVAAQIWLVANHTAYIVKLAYDPKFACYSPGTILSAALFEHVIDVDGVRTIDYLIGDDPYKRDWMTRRRERRGLVAFNKHHWRGVLGAMRHRTGKMFPKRHRSMIKPQ